jgi:hypothetical protein
MRAGCVMGISSELNLEIHSEPDDKLTPENYLLRIGTASAE